MKSEVTRLLAVLLDQIPGLKVMRDQYHRNRLLPHPHLTKLAYATSGNVPGPPLLESQ